MLDYFLLCLLVLDETVESDSAMLYLGSTVKPQLKVGPFRKQFFICVYMVIAVWGLIFFLLTFSA